MKPFIQLLIVVVLLGCGYWLGMTQQQSSKAKTHQNADVVIENIKRVWKLSTVEAQVSEIYKFTNHIYYKIAPLRKTALVKVDAKVLAGFDFDQMQMELDEDTRTLTISHLPKAQILSIDHDLEYYDIRAGAFNVFTPEDLSRLQSDAKDSIQNDVLKKHILDDADASMEDMLEVLRLAVEGMGWRIVMDDTTKTDELFVD